MAEVSLLDEIERITEEVVKKTLKEVVENDLEVIVKDSIKEVLEEYGQRRPT